LTQKKKKKKKKKKNHSLRGREGEKGNNAPTAVKEKDQVEPHCEKEMGLGGGVKFKREGAPTSHTRGFRTVSSRGTPFYREARGAAVKTGEKKITQYVKGKSFCLLGKKLAATKGVR